MHRRSRVLDQNIAVLSSARVVRNPSSLAADGRLQRLVADLVSARVAAGMTQEDVAARMGTTKSAVCRLERGVRTPPTLRTIERYARAVSARVEIRVRTER